MGKQGAAGSPDRLTQMAIKELYSVMEDSSVKPPDREQAVIDVVNALRNVMSVSDITRLLEEIRRRK